MNPVKIAAIVLIISAGLVGSYFIVKKASPPISDKEDISPLNETNSLFQKPIQWVEKLKDFVNKQQEEPENSAANTSVPADDSFNLTKFVAGSLFGRMKNLDQSSKNSFEGQGIDINDPENQKLIEEAMADITDPFNPKIENKDLKISGDNSKEAKLSYLKSIQEIGQKYFSNPDFKRDSDQLMEDINQDCLGNGNTVNSKIASAYNDIAVNYLNLNIPSDWSDTHREMIIYVKRGYLIFDALANCSIDPIKGYLAGRTLPQFASESQTIQEALKEKAVEISLLP